MRKRRAPNGAVATWPQKNVWTLAQERTAWLPIKNIEEILWTVVSRDRPNRWLNHATRNGMYMRVVEAV